MHLDISQRETSASTYVLHLVLRTKSVPNFRVEAEWSRISREECILKNRELVQKTIYNFQTEVLW